MSGAPSSDDMEGRGIGKEDISDMEMVLEETFEQVSRQRSCKIVNLTTTTSVLVPVKNTYRIPNSGKTPVDNNNPKSSVQRQISSIVVKSKIASTVKSSSYQQKLIADLSKNSIDYFTDARKEKKNCPKSSPGPSSA